MKLLIAAATQTEIQPAIAYLNEYGDLITTNVYRYGGHEIHLLITGVGILNAAYTLCKKLSTAQYDFALQVGVAGSFDTKIDLTQVVLVQSETLGDMGAEDNDRFLDLFTLGLEDIDRFPFTNGKLECPLHHIPFAYRLLTVDGLTVNATSGSHKTIANRKELFNCQVESMEGAAFHYVCINEHLPFAQVRSISNYVRPRNKDEWKMKDAIHSLNMWIIELLNQL